MRLSSEKAADMAGIVDEIGEDVAWNGHTYKAIITPLETSDSLQIGGFAEEYDFIVKIPRATLGSLMPKKHDVIQFDGKSYKIARITESKPYPMLILAIHSK